MIWSWSAVVPQVDQPLGWELLPAQGTLRLWNGMGVSHWLCTEAGPDAHCPLTCTALSQPEDSLS